MRNQMTDAAHQLEEKAWSFVACSDAKNRARETRYAYEEEAGNRQHLRHRPKGKDQAIGKITSHGTKRAATLAD